MRGLKYAALVTAILALSIVGWSQGVFNTVGPSSSQQHTLPSVAPDTIVLASTSQNLSNKTFSGNPMSIGSNRAVLTAPFTDANASGLQLIPGLAFTYPSSFSGNVAFHCTLGYSEATPAAGAGPGVAVLTTAPTRLDATTIVYSSAAGASANAPITNLATTTPTAGATVTPGSTVVYPIIIDGVAQLAGGGTQTLQFYIQQGTAADVIAVAAGSNCFVW